MATFVCTRCKRVVHNRYEMFQERMEYRRVDGDARRLVFTVRDLCVGCVDEIGEEHRNPTGAVQESLAL